MQIASAAILAIAAGGILSASAMASSSSPPAELHLVPLDELNVPIVDSGRLDGTLRVRFMVNTVDAASADALGQRLPELRSLALGAATDFSQIYASGMAPVNAEILKQKMRAALQHAHPEIADVLVIQVSAAQA
ncbi:MAG: flagellar basal body-associated FliL family protein [Alphaproteobacteria bacterium]|nr:flagellar basal body-associated FliL family protein [Alphaproteobacteria bacterium]